MTDACTESFRSMQKLHHTMEAGYVQKYSFNLLRQDLQTFLGLLMNKNENDSNVSSADH